MSVDDRRQIEQARRRCATSTLMMATHLRCALRIQIIFYRHYVPTAHSRSLDRLKKSLVLAKSKECMLCNPHEEETMLW
jgi:hypothetical protein